jgi:hypothetical protein
VHVSRAPDEDDEPIPRLPRGGGWRFSRGELVRIAMFAALLVAVLVLRKPCAENVGGFIQSFSPPIDAGPAPAAPSPGFTAPSVPAGEYVHCRVDEPPAACIERLDKARNQAPAPPDAGAPPVPSAPAKSRSSRTPPHQ